MEIIFLLSLFQIKHWYADFHIQTYAQTVRKGVWLDSVGVSHSIDHVYTTMIVLLFFSIIYYISPLFILIISVIEGLVHYLVDFIKVKYGSKDSTSPKYWSQFGVDQLFHHFTYLIITYYICLLRP
jgi:hypothetical protein